MAADIITIAVIAWLGQIFLGWYQVKSFNHALVHLADSGRVGIGRSNRHFKSRVIIAIAVDEKGTIASAIIMEGITVFARPKVLPELWGKLVNDLEPDLIFPDSIACREALRMAMMSKI
ncbi:transcriptional regulator GutM [Xenorhabdus szentirmaii]|uniref:Glucitol operon activator protein n=2 Tax=Xenorhabdus szentirmaii TaxID=290112 RepID=W1J3F0_9GAMM|nr:MULTISPECIES: transcriptional regulator GutM [Xenorhabdus]MBD2780860.1 transcriptional regulator GutM [Xenorhabdus sp. 38]MBD2799714.1 transcriptional regulator GutM [Xenorhabdus sp. M]MBD2803281.1 transcriptional regulator GutM [Xenorhabdus sp. ZM]MBD2821561.1 transcriptional regulator GutM [Xenorhabdus sp. 42]PHM31896.1 hypothetical protein Xsze_02620 [Xenorhabdus szentirmaii DSM 16338]